MRIKGRLSNNALWGGGELYRGSVIRDEEDHWEVELKEVVEPTKVGHRQLSP
jgi:hypothetical protein